MAELLRERLTALDGEIALEGELWRAQRKRLEETAADLQAQNDAMGDLLTEVEAFSSVVEDSVERERTLKTKGLSTAGALEQKLEQSLAQHVAIATLKRDRVQPSAQQNERRADVVRQRLDYEKQLSELQLEKNAVFQEHTRNERDRELQIVSPRDGTVASLSLQLGQAVTSGTPLLTVMPQDSRLEAVFLVPSDAIGTVREGSPVFLRYTAFPYQKFGQYEGVVTPISLSSLTEQEAQAVNGGVEGIPTGPVFKIVTEPKSPYVLVKGQRQPLQPGMQVEARIFAERHALYEWVFEPLVPTASAGEPSQDEDAR